MSQEPSGPQRPSELTERERWRRKRLILSAVPFAGWVLFALALVIRGGGQPGLAMGCVGIMVISALVLGGAAVTIAMWLSRNDQDTR